MSYITSFFFNFFFSETEMICFKYSININVLIMIIITRKTYLRYLRRMSPLNAAICTTISYTLWVEWYYLRCYGLDKKILFKKQLFDIEVNGQGPTKVITVCDTPPYGNAPHTKYNWPIWKDKTAMVRTSFAEKKQKKRKWKKKSD